MANFLKTRLEVVENSKNISIPLWEISMSATNLNTENLTKCKAPNIFIAQHLFKSEEKWKNKFLASRI